MTDHPTRTEGFYWVSDAGSEPEVALWQAGRWWLAGSEEPTPSGGISVLGERLMPVVPVS